ncbi:MAG: DUF2786 domain-containing protein [Myxococcota bacterium]
MSGAYPIVDPVVDRVRKLLALAGSPNVHEAAAAAARAQRLIEAHRLEGWFAAPDAPDPDPIVDGWHEPLEVARRIRKWKVALAAGLADANDCLVYTGRAEDGERVVLVGRGADRVVVAELYTWLARRIEWLSATHGAGKPRAWHESFRVGAVDAVLERMAGDRHVPEPAAIATVDRVRLARREALAAFTRAHLRLGPGRALRVDRRAWSRGRDAGAELALPDDV